MNIATLNAARKMDQLEEKVCSAVSLLETLENSLFFASERADKDLTKASARSAEVAIKLVEECLSDVYDLKHELNKLTAEPREV